MSKIKVKMDNDGNAYLDEDTLRQIVAPLNQEIHQLKAHAAQVGQQSQARNAVKSIIDSVQGGNEAKIKLDKAFKSLNTAIIDIQRENNIPQIDPDTALDLLEASGFDAEFSKEFPELDIEVVAKAYMSKRNLKKALSSIAGDSTASANSRKAAPTKKFLGLASTPLDIVDGSDDDIAAIERQLAEDSKTGIIG